jgi:hypothetical protein
LPLRRPRFHRKRSRRYRPSPQRQEADLPFVLAIQAQGRDEEDIFDNVADGQVARSDEEARHRQSLLQAAFGVLYHCVRVMGEENSSFPRRPLEDLWITGPREACVLHPEKVHVRFPPQHTTYGPVVEVLVGRERDHVIGLTLIRRTSGGVGPVLSPREQAGAQSGRVETFLHLLPQARCLLLAARKVGADAVAVAKVPA